jgi:hypothetical protein
LASGGGGFPCRGVRGDSGRLRAVLGFPHTSSLVLPLMGSAGSSRSWVHRTGLAGPIRSSHSNRVAGRWSFQPSSLTLQGFTLRVYEVLPSLSTRGVGSSFRSTFLAFAPPSETSIHSARADEPLSNPTVRPCFAYPLAPSSGEVTLRRSFGLPLLGFSKDPFHRHLDLRPSGLVRSFELRPPR